MADRTTSPDGAANAPTLSAAGTVPRHVAIIMDGNGRWAAQRGMPRSFGHRSGVEAVRRTVRTALDLKISYLTLYSFSSENWSRPPEEIEDLMGLLKRFIRGDLADLHQSNVRVMVIGERETIDQELRALIDEACDLTRDNTRLTLVIAFNYGARGEMTRAARRLADEVAQGRLAPSDITTERLAAALDTGTVPDPELLIRTGGEQRLSNFLLWQCAYTELVFLDAYWPDFGRELMLEAISQFNARERRFGGLSCRSTA